jgi:hypothetical protein
VLAELENVCHGHGLMSHLESLAERDIQQFRDQGLENVHGYAICAMSDGAARVL